MTIIVSKKNMRNICLNVKKAILIFNNFYQWVNPKIEKSAIFVNKKNSLMN
jgi:hypothetical protein